MKAAAVLPLLLLSACSGSVAPCSEYTGVWVTDSTSSLSRGAQTLNIAKDGDMFTMKLQDGVQVAGPCNNGVLHFTGMMGAMDVVYLKSSDTLSIMGLQYRRMSR